MCANDDVLDLIIGSKRLSDDRFLGNSLVICNRSFGLYSKHDYTLNNNNTVDCN